MSVEETDFDALPDVSDESVTVTRELKKFPLCPKGMHNAKCIDAKIREVEFQGRKNSQLSLTWELETTFEDEDNDGNKVQKPFRVFDSLSLYFGPKARLHQAFKELTGEDVNALVVEKEFKKDGKKFISSTFRYPAFVEMKAQVLVKHKESKSDPTKIFANIEAYTCDEATQKYNASLVFDDGAKE